MRSINGSMPSLCKQFNLYHKFESMSTTLTAVYFDLGAQPTFVGRALPAREMLDRPPFP
jgi:hypothetical protein